MIVCRSSGFFAESGERRQKTDSFFDGAPRMSVTGNKCRHASRTGILKKRAGNAPAPGLPYVLRKSRRPAALPQMSALAAESVVTAESATAEEKQDDPQAAVIAASAAIVAAHTASVVTAAAAAEQQDDPENGTASSLVTGTSTTVRCS